MTVRMTFPQMCRREATVDVRFAPMEHRLLTLLLLRSPDEFVPIGDVIQYLWPDPDTQALTANQCAEIYLVNLRKAGVPVENYHGFGWRIPKEARS